MVLRAALTNPAAWSALAPYWAADCLGWARTAHYITAVADDGDVQLRSESGAPTRYFIRRRGADRLELNQADDDDA